MNLNNNQQNHSVSVRTWGRRRMPAETENIFARSAVAVSFFLAAICLAACPVSAAAGDDDGIAVVVSDHTRPFVQAMEGFNSGILPEPTVYYIDDNPELVRHRLSEKKFRLVVAIGPVAAHMVWAIVKNPAERMVLMVLDPQDLLADSHVCGVHLRVPASDQFNLIRKKIGGGAQIGVLYNPEENAEWIGRGADAAVQAGVELIPLTVTERQEVLKVLLAADRNIDTLLFIPDPTVISEAMVAHLVKKALLRGIASVGYNRFFLEVGAVLSFNIDYRAVGVLGAEIAAERLSGRGCALYPPPFDVGWNNRAWELVRRTRRAR